MKKYQKIFLPIFWVVACMFLLVNCWYKTANIAVQDRPVTVQQSTPTLTKDAAIKAANVIHDMTVGVLKKTMEGN